MMNKNILILFLGVLFFTFTSNEVFAQKKKKPVYFENKEIGWSLPLPEGWIITEGIGLKAQNKKVKKLYESKDIMNQDSDDIIIMTKDDANSFSATWEYLATPSDRKLKLLDEELKTLIQGAYEEGYADYGVTVTVTESRPRVIAGVDFLTSDIFLVVEGTDVFIVQTLYVAIIKNGLFTVAFTYSDDAYRDELEESLMNSKFKK